MFLFNILFIINKKDLEYLNYKHFIDRKLKHTTFKKKK